MRFCTKLLTMNFSTKTHTLHTILCFFFCCCCLCLIGLRIYTENYPENKFVFNHNGDSCLKNIERGNIMTEIGGGGARRVLLGGPGSSPPRCMSKCGRCMPCKPVHVPVPPGTRVTTEYYPEAWRCKCGNKLYMP